ncbi:MAG: dUTP diphosphatase [Spirochaetales bacterium]|nr:dUTP diphosphatase [Spirochaetales bacterium]
MNGKKIKVIINGDKSMLPEYQSDSASGADLKANITEDIILKPLERAIVPTGLRVQIPDGFEAQVRPRSGLAVKHGITVLNTPGTIDADYRGEVKVILINLNNNEYTIKRGDRIAQIVFSRVEKADFILSTQEIDKTQRGEGGFGSTGL